MGCRPVAAMEIEHPAVGSYAEWCGPGHHLSSRGAGFISPGKLVPSSHEALGLPCCLSVLVQALRLGTMTATSAVSGLARGRCMQKTAQCPTARASRTHVTLMGVWRSQQAISCPAQCHAQLCCQKQEAPDPVFLERTAIMPCWLQQRSPAAADWDTARDIQRGDLPPVRRWSGHWRCYP